jgi:hypothetical protein
MACIVKANRHGYLAYRLFWRGLKSWEGTGLKDTPKNREKLERRAIAMSDEIVEGTFDYLRWFPKGNKAHLFRPAAPSAAPTPTLREYADQTWLPRKVAPMVRATLADTYRCELRRHILFVFGDKPLDAVTPATLEDFRSLLTRPSTEGGKGLKVKTARCIIDGTARSTATPGRPTVSSPPTRSRRSAGRGW